MNISDGIIDKWAAQAMEDMGEQSWRDLDPNSMMLIIYSVQKSRDRKIVRKITKPIWWLLATVAAGVLYFIIESLFV